MWLGIWASTRRGEKRWIRFVRRYWQFHPDDCVIICVSHHAEIHAIYDRIIQQDMAERGKRLSKYGWPEAMQLMNRLETACREWEKVRTPGISSSRYQVVRAMRSNQRRRQG